MRKGEVTMRKQASKQEEEEDLLFIGDAEFERAKEFHLPSINP